MRPDAAARRRVAHHQVVEPRVRDEREAPQQRVGRVAVQVHALHEQRPVAARQARERGAAERSVRRANSDCVPCCTSRDATSSRAGEREELVARDDAGEPRHAAADEQAASCASGARRTRPACVRRAVVASRAFAMRASIASDRRPRHAGGTPDAAAHREVRRRAMPRLRCAAPLAIPQSHSCHECLRQHRRHAVVQAVRFEQPADRGNRRADRLPARRPFRHLSESRSGAQSRRRSATRCRSRSSRTTRSATTTPS